MSSGLFLCLVVLGVGAFPQAENGCGVDERGIARQPGDNWREDCNRCRCLTAGIPGCTKKFCGGFPTISAPESKGCLDSLGNTRQEGEKWEDKADVCSCGQGVVVCTALIAVTDTKKDNPSSAAIGVNFPGGKQVKDASTCTDQGGKQRGEGETWKEDCNTCGCYSGVAACTEVFCVDIVLDTSEVPTLFSSDLSREVSQTAQCKQAGVTNCRAVTINLEQLETVNPGDEINFISGVDLSMKLRRAPSGSASSTMSYSFSLLDGGEGTVTVRPNKSVDTAPSVFASIKPVTGSVIYSVEACGRGCNVLYERDSDYFNQFED